MTIYPLLALGIFLVGTIFLTWVSRRALRQPGSHGFYRFFAWEALLALVLLNMRYWFIDPFSPHQIIAWVLLLASLVLVSRGVVDLKEHGKPGKSRQAPDLFGIEKTTDLVTGGIYHTIRHPLYCSLLCLGWGIFFKQPWWAGGLLVTFASACLYLTARVEETENLAYFGEAYAEYQKHTWMFVPYLI